MTEKKSNNPQIDYVHFDKLMEEKKWGPPELAEYAQINYNTAYKIVHRQRANPNSNTLLAIARALGCSTDYLLGKSEYRNPPIDKLPEQVRQLARIAGRLSEARQRELVKVAEALEELEREQPVYTITGEAMNSLLEILDGLESDDENAETYLLLSALLRSASPSLLDLPANKNGGKPLEH